MQLGGAGVGWRRVHRRTSWQVSHGRLLSLVDVFFFFLEEARLSGGCLDSQRGGKRT